MKHLFIVSLAGLAATAAPAMAQDIQTPDDARSAGLESLRLQLEIDGGPPLPDIADHIVTHPGLVRALGKALFFDMAAASDGINSCASCHFHAGADNRSMNQISPGLLRVENSREGDIIGFSSSTASPDTTFQLYGPNRDTSQSDYPLVRDIGSGDNVVDNGGILEPAEGNSNDVISSQGVVNTHFLGTDSTQLQDLGIELPDPVFNDSGFNTRRVEPRNTPTVINAVFNYDNFWDGRAKHCFNGVDPFGNQSDAKVFVATEDTRNDTGDTIFGIDRVELRIERASLASQAVGPPLSDFEMSWAGRGWNDVARKLLTRLGLAVQEVHQNDSLLALLRHPSGMGLKYSYEDMIKLCFHPKWWDSPKHVYFPESGDPEIVDPGTTDPDSTYTLMEANFSMFFGISVMLYESLLISDTSPFDKWMETGEFLQGFGPFQLAGLNVFAGKGKCINCHGGPEFTGASIRNAQSMTNILEFMVMANREPAIYDNGFYNIGVTPTTDDIARGGSDPFGNPLASSRQVLFHANDIQSIDFSSDPESHGIKGLPHNGLHTGHADHMDNHILGVHDEDTGEFIPVCRDLDNDMDCDLNDEWLIDRVAVDGSFKTPGLRNVVLTGPYMHNGGFATLREVVEFYNRGGNFCKTNIDDLDPDITKLELLHMEKNQLIAFLVSLTDPRVARRSGFFDGPQVWVPVGHLHGATVLEEVEATGSEGLPNGGHLNPFLNLSPFYGNSVEGLCSPDLPKEEISDPSGGNGRVARK